MLLQFQIYKGKVAEITPTSFPSKFERGFHFSTYFRLSTTSLQVHCMPKSQQTYIFFFGWVAYVLLLLHKFGLLDLRLLQNSICINSFPSTLGNYYLSLFSCPAFSASFLMESMDRRRRRRRKQAKINNSESEGQFNFFYLRGKRLQVSTFSRP